MTIIDTLLPYQKKFFLSQKKRKLWISGRQLGKTHCVAAALVYKALKKRNGLSLCISTGARAAAEIVKKCALFAEAVKQVSLGAIDYTVSFDSVKFSNGCRVLSLPGSTDGANLRGYSAQAVVIDEACFIPHLEDIMQAIAPTLTRCPDAELMLATTPAGKNNEVYKIYQDALDSDDWYVQETTVHSAIEDGLKVSLDALHTLCPDPDRFAQEYECKWLSEYGSFIDTSIVDFVDEIPAGDCYYCGMDIGRTNDSTAIATLKQVESQTFLEDICILRRCEYQKQLDVLRTLHGKYHYKAGFIDQTGIGSAVAEFATKQVASMIKGLSFTAANKTPMYEALRSKIFDHTFLANSKFKDIITQDFNNIERIVNEAGSVKYQAGHGFGHSDVTSAIVLALAAAKQHPANFQLPQAWAFPTRLSAPSRLR